MRYDDDDDDNTLRKNDADPRIIIITHSVVRSSRLSGEEWTDAGLITCHQASSKCPPPATD